MKEKVKRENEQDCSKRRLPYPKINTDRKRQEKKNNKTSGKKKTRIFLVDLRVILHWLVKNNCWI